MEPRLNRSRNGLERMEMHSDGPIKKHDGEYVVRPAVRAEGTARRRSTHHDSTEIA